MTIGASSVVVVPLGVPLIRSVPRVAATARRRPDRLVPVRRRRTHAGYLPYAVISGLSPPVELVDSSRISLFAFMTTVVNDR